MEKTYNQYLFSQVLNEMYYGKHNKFKEIENLFDKLKKLFIKHDHIVKVLKNKNIRKLQMRGKRKNSYNEVYNIKNHLFKNINESNLDDNQDSNPLIEKFVEEIENEQLVKNTINDPNEMENMYNIMCKKMALLDTVDQSLLQGTTRGVDYNKIKDMIELATKNANLKDEDVAKASGIKTMFGSAKLFIPISLSEAQEYDKILNSLSDILQDLFNIPKVKFLVVSKTELINFAYIPNESLMEVTRKNNIQKKYNNSERVKTLISKAGFNKLSSDNNILKFKTQKSKLVLFATSTKSFKELPANILTGLFLHEIGHCFAFDIFAPDIAIDFIAQERFADAFAVKFGYGVELVESIKYMGVSLIRSLRNFAGLGYWFSKDPIEKQQILISVLTNPTTAQKLAGDDHPSNIDRYNEILLHLKIELDNPRVSPLKKKDIQNQIEKIKKVIPNYNFSDDDINGAFEVFEKGQYKFKLSKFKMKKSELIMNSKIIRDILDNIYDKAMGNM